MPHLRLCHSSSLLLVLLPELKLLEHIGGSALPLLGSRGLDFGGRWLLRCWCDRLGCRSCNWFWCCGWSGVVLEWLRKSGENCSFLPSVVVAAAGASGASVVATTGASASTVQRSSAHCIEHHFGKRVHGTCGWSYWLCGLDVCHLGGVLEVLVCLFGAVGSRFLRF